MSASLATPATRPATTTGGAAPRTGRLLGGLAIVGIATHVVVHLLLSAYYAKFGSTPEEVGWGPSRVLTTVVVPWLLLGGATFALARAWRLRGAGPTRREDVRPGGAWRPADRFAGGAAVAMLLFLTVAAGQDLRLSADRIQAGQQVTSGAVVDLFPVRAGCVTAGVSAGTAPLAGGRPVQLLGSAGGTTVLRDPVAGRTLRVPTDSLTLLGAACPGLAGGGAPGPERPVALIGAGIGLAGLGLVLGARRLLAPALEPLAGRLRALVTETRVRSSHIAVRNPGLGRAPIDLVVDLIAAEQAIDVVTAKIDDGEAVLAPKPGRGALRHGPAPSLRVQASIEGGWLIVDQQLTIPNSPAAEATSAAGRVKDWTFSRPRRTLDLVDEIDLTAALQRQGDATRAR